MVPVAASHNDMCHLRETDAHYKPVNDWLEEVIDTAIDNVQELAAAMSNESPAEQVVWTDSFSELSAIEHLELKSAHERDPDKYQASEQSDQSHDLVSKQASQSSGQHHPRLPCHIIRPHTQNPGFFGRQDVLIELDRALLPSARDPDSPVSMPQSFALCGFGGIGKTQIAVEYAFSRLSHFDAVFWLHADADDKLGKDFTNISLALGLEETIANEVDSRNRVLAWLSGEVSSPRSGNSIRHNAKWLLIFDNADNLEVVTDYFPHIGSGSVLITSRDPLAKTKQFFPIMGGRDLETFSTADAAKLLRELTRQDTDDEDVLYSQKIASILGGLPLAITQSAGTISRRDLSLSEFHTLLMEQSNRVELYQSREGQPVGGFELKTIYSVWAFQDLSEGATSLMEMITFLDPDRISESLLQIVVGRAERDFVGLERYPKTLLQFINARTELSKASIVRRNVALKDLTIHRLIQDSFHSHMTMERRSVTFENIVNVLCRSWPFGAFDFTTKRYNMCEVVFPHIRHLSNSYKVNGSKSTNGQCMKDFSRLCMDAAWYRLERGSPRDGLPIIQIAQGVCDNYAGSPDADLILADIHHVQSEIALLTNRPNDMLENATKTIKYLTRNNDKTIRVPMAQNIPALANIMLQRYQQAAHHAQLSIDGFWALPDAHWPDSATVSKGYALMFQGTEESLKEASRTLEEHLKYRADTFGIMDDESFKTGLSMLCLGDVRACQGRWDESFELHSKTLTQYISTLGESHHRTAAVHIKLGDHYMRLARWKEAETHLQRALSIYADRNVYAAESARAQLKWISAQEGFGDTDGARETRSSLSGLLEVLSKKHGRSIVESDVDGLVPFWSK